MTATVEYIWPAATNTYVALLQTYVGAATLLLNGTGVNPFPQFIRTITLTSVNNNAGVNFTITGSVNGRFLQEVIAGPNNNTVSSGLAYDTISSITTNGAINAVSVGIGQIGLTQWFTNDYYRSVFNMSVAVDITGNITYSLSGTLDDVTQSAPFVFEPVATFVGLNADHAGNSEVPVRYSSIIITASVGAATLRSTFLQQGIK